MSPRQRLVIFVNNIIVTAAALGSAIGCASATHRRAEGFDPRVPLRVAVLPFIDPSGGDTLVSTPLVAAVDLVPIISDDRLAKEHAATLLREHVAGSLRRTALDVVDLHVVDTLLGHRGMDVVAAYDGDRKEAARALGEAIGADAVLYGWVLEWDREYYFLESVARVGVRVELCETTTGEVLFEGEAHDAKHAGLSKLPVAYDPRGAIQAGVVEPLKGLRNTVLATLADDVSRTIVTGLAPPAEERAAAPAPRISFVAHSAAGPLRVGDELTVVALADAGLHATFEVGEDFPPVPMTASAPGSYRGTLRISPAHRFREATVTVRVVSRALAASTMTVGHPGVTTGGTADIARAADDARNAAARPRTTR